MKSRLIAAGAAVALVLAASGCATIVARSSQKVAVSSTPPGALVTITNRGGQVVKTGTTPIEVTLKMGSGYFRAENYTLRFSKDGFEPHELKLTPAISGWYFGIILFGGLIGMLAVDPSTGAMYKLEPKTIEAALVAAKVSQLVEPGAVVVVSTADLPPTLGTKNAFKP
jgi:hypothetical protein